MKSYTIHELSEILHAKQRCSGPDSLVLSKVETDSRYVTLPEKTVFFALDGIHTAGHLYIPELVQKGVAAFVTHHPIEPMDHVWILQVDDSLAALQTLAAHHRKNFNLPVIGITGSNGKTITKEWLSQLLGQQYNVCRNPKSYNSQLGVALSVMDLDSSHSIAIFEAGISQPGEMQTLSEIIAADFGIFTNIGDAHDNGFLHRHQKILEKKRLFARCKNYLYCGDYPDLHEVLQEDPAAISWGAGVHNQLQIHLHQKSESDFPSLKFNWNSQDFHFELPFKDQASIENLTHCIIAALYFGLTENEIQQTVQKLHGLRLRLEQKEGLHECVLINDSYSLDLKSLSLALRFLDQQNDNLSRSLVLSDFARRDHDTALLTELSGLIHQFKIRRVVAIGEQIAGIRSYLNPNIAFHHFNSTEHLIQQADGIGFHRECILIKGARQFALEKFFQSFSLSRHDTILEVDLASILHNVSVYKSRLKPSTRIMAVVKASAYGSGQYEIAKFLEHKGVDYLAVAYPDEGILLRQKGIRSRIMVMNTAHADFGELMEFQLEPEIFSATQIQRILDSVGGNPIEIHLKIESGMNRLGLAPEDVSTVSNLILSNPHIKIASVFSHLSASDQEEFDPFTKRQFEVFKKAFDQICDTIAYRPIAHLLNSGGISRHPELQLDMVRLGIGLYGIDHDPYISHVLERVHSLKTRISQIKTVEKEQTISYNRSGKVHRASRIAVLSMGYADGLPRIAGERKFKVLVHGSRQPLIGVVCMDMCMVDVTDIPEAIEGDEVEIFGKNNDISQLAELCDTIPYEILCGISHRVRRVFVQ
ncbi:MAG: bifunctional UDP-N-acetylmuramoyl-tripeptide:D-alanyl-D-alanine ligase/alanine racemase [Saprospiraceae bacterium]|nr:bifunctional UDP-N-acetylmuramoyl-tripeptide:D-alanyl-D-alanine ligase/alanine racemase [Saprospiraceae bacterium]